MPKVNISFKRALKVVSESVISILSGLSFYQWADETFFDRACIRKKCRFFTRLICRCFECPKLIGCPFDHIVTSELNFNYTIRHRWFISRCSHVFFAKVLATFSKLPDNTITHVKIISDLTTKTYVNFREKFNDFTKKDVTFLTVNTR